MDVRYDRIKEVRDLIAGKPEAAVDISSFGYPTNLAPCGTAACIAGWATWLYDREAWDRYMLQRDGLGEMHEDLDRKDDPWHHVNVHPFHVAMRELGLHEEDANMLFYLSGPLWYVAKESKEFRTSKQQALMVLDAVLERGTVTLHDQEWIDKAVANRELKGMHADA